MAGAACHVWLFVPGSHPQRFAKARATGANAVIVDLEDAVAPTGKATARAAVTAALADGTLAGQPAVCVRINGMRTSWWEDDLAAVALPGLSFVMVPKAEDPAELTGLAIALEELETRRGLPRGSIRLIPLIETAAGILAAPALARVPRAAALAFGALDYIQDISGRLTPERTELLFARSQVVLVARAAGIEAIDTVYPDLEDDAGLLAEATTARNLGFSGKLVIHPRQIQPVHQAFQPTAAEIAFAQEVCAAFAQAAASGEAAIRVRGKFVDPPVMRWAQAVLDRMDE